jgi:hypothetical protein
MDIVTANDVFFATVHLYTQGHTQMCDQCSRSSNVQPVGMTMTNERMHRQIQTVLTLPISKKCLSQNNAPLAPLICVGLHGLTT